MEQQNQFQFSSPKGKGNYYNLLTEVNGSKTFKKSGLAEKDAILLQKTNPRKKQNYKYFYKERADDFEYGKNFQRSRKASNCNANTDVQIIQNNPKNQLLKRAKSQKLIINNSVAHQKDFAQQLNYKRKNVKDTIKYRTKMCFFENKKNNIIPSKYHNSKSAIFQNINISQQEQYSKNLQKSKLSFKKNKNDQIDSKNIEEIKMINYTITKLLQQTKNCIQQSNDQQNDYQESLLKRMSDQNSSDLSTKLNLLEDRVLKLCKSSPFFKKQNV